MRVSYWWAVILVVVFATGRSKAQELNIESRYVNNLLQPGSQGNLTLWQQQQLTILFSDLSFQSNSERIGDLYYSFVCPPPSAPFQATLVGFVPANQEVYESVVCQVGNQQLFNFTNTSHVAPAGSVSRRRLFQLDILIQSFDPGLPCQINGFLASNIDSGLASSHCGGGGDPNAGDQIAFLRQLGAFASAQDVWDEQAYKGFSKQDVINQGVGNLLNQQVKINEGLQASEQTLSNQIGILGSATQAQFEQVKSQMTDTLHDIAAVGNQLVSYTDAQVAQLANKTVTAINVLAANTAGAFSNVSVNDQKYQRSLQTLSTTVKQLSQALNDITQETPYANALATKVWANIATMQSKGQVPFISDVEVYSGTEPLAGGLPAMPLGQRTGTVDTITLNFVNQSASLVSHSYTITLFCDNFNQTTLSSPSYKDFLQMVGPTGCAVNASTQSDIVKRCKCWLQITHVKCVPGGSFTSWLDVTTLQDRTAYKLNPSLCQGNIAPVAGPWDGTVIDDITVFNGFLSELCFMVPAVTQNYILMVSQRLGRRVITTEQDPSICGMDFNVIFGTQYDVVNLPFAVYTDWTLAYKSYQIDVNVFRKLLQGGLPHYVTYAYNPFTIMPDGTYGRCYTAYVTGVSTNTVPVYQLTPLPIVTSVTINAYATPPVCGINGCIFPPTVSHQTTSTLTPTINEANLLPQAGDLVFGELSPGMSSIYDTDRKLTSTSSAAPAREVTYNYLMQPVPDGFNPLTDSPPPTWTIDQFIAYNTFAPLHNRAVITISDTQMPFIGGRAIPAVNQRKQWLATALDSFAVAGLTNMKAGMLVLQPSGHWEVTAIVNTVIGEVVQTVFTGCPSFYFQVYSTAVVNLVVTNVQPFPVEVQLDIAYSGICPVPGSQKLSLASKQQFIQLIPPCGNVFAQVFTIGVGGVLSPCQTVPLNVTINPALVTSIDPFTLIGGDNTTLVNNQALSLVGAAANGAASVIYNLGTTLLIAFRNPNFTIADFEIAVNNTIAQTIAGINAQAAAVAAANVDILALLKPGQDQFNAQQANLTLEIQQQAGQITNVTNAIESFHGIVTVLKNDTNAVNESVVRLEAAINVLIADLQRQVANAATDCNSLSFFASIWCQLKQIFYWLIIGGVIVTLLICLLPICLPQIMSAVNKTQQGVAQAQTEAEMQKIRNETNNAEQHRLLEKQRDELKQDAGDLEVKGRASLRQSEQRSSVSALLPDSVRRSIPARRTDYVNV